VRALERAYGNPRLTLADYAWLLRVEPLRLWCAGELARNPQLGWDELLARIECDAFERMTPYWRELGFPFERLVPSHATAIGSSADRPAALVELMGIVLNDGRRLPTVDMQRLQFAAGTPWHTVLERTPAQGTMVMRPEAARQLRALLAAVVERGTARRLHGAFAGADGHLLAVGGKTGSGDNRIESSRRGERLIGERSLNRTASFVFYVGDRWFGGITVAVDGPRAANYSFTSSLPLAVLKLLWPVLRERIAPAPASAPPLISPGQARASSSAASSASGVFVADRPPRRR
jgi:hypothetical protein